MNDKSFDQFTKEFNRPTGSVSVTLDGSEILDNNFKGVLFEKGLKDHNFKLEKRNKNFFIFDYKKKSSPMQRTTFSPLVLGHAKHLKFTITWSPENIDLVVFPVS